MTGSAVAQGGQVDLGLVKFVGQREGVGEELVVVHEQGHQRFTLLEFVENGRIVGDLPKGERFDGRLRFLQILDGAMVEGVVAPHTDGLILWCFLSAVRTVDRRIVGRILGLDILTVHLGVLGGAVVAVHRDVVGNRVAAALTALTSSMKLSFFPSFANQVALLLRKFFGVTGFLRPMRSAARVKYREKVV